MKTQNFTLTVSTIILGGLVGISSLLLSLFLNLIEKLFLHFNETALHPIATGGSGVARLISVVIGGLLASIIWWFLRTKVTPPATIEQGLGGRNMPAIQTFFHVVTQIFYVGTGGSVGRELAPREAGAMIAQKWQQLLTKSRLTQLSEADTRLLMAAAAGAGFAGVYNAPLTGMFFCVEVLYRKVSIRTVSVSLAMSILSTLVSTSVRGTAPYYLVPHSGFSPAFLPIAVLVAVLSGLLGALFRKAFKWAGRSKPKNWQMLWQLPVASLATGLISMNFPQIMGNGRALAQFSLNATNRQLLIILLLGGAAKYLITVFVIRAGAFGGTLTPSVAIGASLGALIGILLLPISHLPVWQSALVGGCSLLAASQQAPLMALFMIFEVCHLNSMALIPLGIGVAISITVSKAILNHL